MKNNGGDLTKANVTDLKQFISYLKKERKNSMKRVSNYFSALSSFYDYLLTEKIVETNPIPPVRKRYIRSYKKNGSLVARQLISVDDMAMLINSILDPKWRAIALVFAKTGIRRGELIRIEVNDIDWSELSFLLKPCPKRTNLKVFFDDETARILQVWIQRRDEFCFNKSKNHLFTSRNGTPLQKKVVTAKIRSYAELVGLHDHKSDRLDEKFTPHCFRHWNTTWLLRNGMPREYVKMLRGDAKREAIDIYDHIDYQDLQQKYIECIPQLGIM
jgi:integrase/recombinase XerD